MAEGDVIWLELNAQRAARAVGFWRDLMGWDVGAMHVAPWGMLAVFRQRGTALGLAFNAMGAFAPPRWLPSFEGDVAAAAARVTAAGGEAAGAPQRIPGHGTVVTFRDPAGALAKVIAPEGGLPDAGPGGILGAGLWARGATALAPFYAGLLGREAREPVEAGPGGRVTLLSGDKGARPLWLHDVDYEVTPPRWVPVFHSLAPRGDGRRAEILGATVQVPPWDPGAGPAAALGLAVAGVWSDPAGADFALARPSEHGADP